MIGHLLRVAALLGVCLLAGCGGTASPPATTARLVGAAASAASAKPGVTPVGSVQTLTAATPVQARHWALVLCERQSLHRLASAFAASDERPADIVAAMAREVHPGVRAAVRAGCAAGFRLRGGN